MSHHNNVKKFGRESNQRKALYRSMVSNLLTHGYMTTTMAKAKATRPVVEKLITKARTAGDNQGAIREIISELGNNELLAKKLVSEIAPKYATRPGGYTRIIKLAPRAARGDASPMAMIELV